MNECAGTDVYAKYLSPTVLDVTGEVSRWVLSVGQPSLLHNRRLMSVDRWWQCWDWLSYGQRDVSFSIDSVFEALKARILEHVPEGLALAHQQYRNEPKRMYDLRTEVVRQQPDIFRIPIVRNHWLQCAILERRMREDRVEQVRRGMDAQSVQAAIPNTQVLPAWLSPLQNRL